MCNETYVNMIEPYLRKRYEDRGNKNFSIKARHIAKVMPIHSSIIGKTLMMLKRRGLVELWNEETNTSKTFITKFKGDG